MEAKKPSPDPRSQILQATMDMICEQHISGTTIRGIAERLGISPGLVNYYFPSKKELFLALIDKLIQFYTDEHAAYMADKSVKPEEKLMLMVYKQVEYIVRRKEHVVLFDFWVQAQTDPEIRTKMQELYDNWERLNRQIVEEGIAAGIYDARRARQVPNLLISLVSGAAIQYLLNDKVFDLHSHFDQIYKLLGTVLVEADAVGHPVNEQLRSAL